MKTNRSASILVFALIMVLGLAAPAYAGEFNGKMQAVLEDNQSFIMRDDAGNDHTFRLTRDARLEINGEEVGLEDFNEGDEVTVTWEERNGQKLASIVNCRRLP